MTAEYSATVLANLFSCDGKHPADREHLVQELRCHHDDIRQLVELGVEFNGGSGHRELYARHLHMPGRVVTGTALAVR